MNKKATLMLLSCSLWLATPETWGQSWSVGLQFGEFFSTLRGQQESDFRLGFVAGVQASHYLTEHIVLRLEVNMNRKGSRFEQIAPIPHPGDPEFGNEYILDYLSLPLLLRYSTGKKSNFFAGGGLSIDYLMRQKTDFDLISIDQTDNFRRFDTNIVGSMGGSFPLNDKLTATLELRGLFGLVKIDRPEGVARELGRNTSWGFMAGINYYL